MLKQVRHEGWRFFSKPEGLDLYSMVRWAEEPANLLSFFIFLFHSFLFLGQSDVGGGNYECVCQEKIMKVHYGIMRFDYARC